MKKTFSHGVHPPEAKRTATDPVRRLPFAPNLVLLLAQHLGAPSKPIVHEGQEVRRGQKIAEADGFMSVSLHAPATGVIEKIDDAMNADGAMTTAIHLKTYPGSDQSRMPAQSVDATSLDRQEIINGIQESGIVGLGGAAFPTHVKYSPPEGKQIDTLIINGCECEPYLTSDHRVMLEQPEAIALGIKIVLKATGAKRAIVATESNKRDAAEMLTQAVAGIPEITVETIKTKYPQGAEKMLTRALLGIDIPSGGLPADVGIIVSNVTTIAEIGGLLPAGSGLTERVITISGAGVDKPGNYLIPLGTPLDFVLESTGLNEDARQVLLGGPMMGKSVAYLNTPVTKGITGIVVMTEKESTRNGAKILPCIQCAECVKACPIHLNPSLLGRLARKDKYEVMLQDLHLMDCFECGCCSYVCPSRIPLVQLFRIAKIVNRTRSAQ